MKGKVKDWFREERRIEEIGLFEAVDAVTDKDLKLPFYQREAVWSEERVCALWDSLLRGFPLPSFILAKGSGSSRELQGAQRGPSTSDDAGSYYDLLDGQQRMDAIYSGFLSNDRRLWIDLAPLKPDHPFKYKFWVHACSRVFPFGFKIEASGEHEFAVLSDERTNDIWKQVQKHTDFKGREFYEFDLAMTFPCEAGSPVPVDELVNFVKTSTPNQYQLIDFIQTLAKKYIKVATDFFQTDIRPSPVDAIVVDVANSLRRLCEYNLALQLIELDRPDDEDDYILYERIGRGGVQITPRQLAVSKLMKSLGKEGNDAINSFQESNNLEHMLETEDIIHGLARVALAATEPPPISGEEPEETANSRDLLDLTPERLRTIKKNKDGWDSFLCKLRSYCVAAGSGQPPRLQQAFEYLYKDLRYTKDNPNGFSLVQLAQPEKKQEGIAPVTLHPLLYWYITNGRAADTNERGEMLRWILFSNGFTNDPQNSQLNREVFRLVRNAGRIDFSEITKMIFQDKCENDKGHKQLQKELGFCWNKLSIDYEHKLIEQPFLPDQIPSPEYMIERTTRRLILQNWATSSISRFTLLWNQREVMEHLYGDIHFIPALFSKGRPFDIDHVVARNRLLYYNMKGIDKEPILDGAMLMLNNAHGSFPFSPDYSDITRSSLNIDKWCFRKSFPNLFGNYRYWPKRLNRQDQDKSIRDKFDLNAIFRKVKDHPLEVKFRCGDEELWRWSAIPFEDKKTWSNLPPEGKWDQSLICDFLTTVLKREFFLYRNAYCFLNEETNLTGKTS
ncbi:MAG: DUF262 domain-containing protein [Syntrophobacteraceae bacterium]